VTGRRKRIIGIVTNTSLFLCTIVRGPSERTSYGDKLMREVESCKVKFCMYTGTPTKIINMYRTKVSTVYEK